MSRTDEPQRADKTLDKPLSELSRVAIKTRIHWLENVDCVKNRVGISTTSELDRYHLLQDADGYKALCRQPYRSNLNVHVAHSAPLQDREPCRKCIAKKQKMLRASRALDGDAE